VLIVPSLTAYGTPVVRRTLTAGAVRRIDALLASGDPAFYTTSHYDGYGAILVDLERVDAKQLAELIEDSWRAKAPVKLRKSFDAHQ